jgi:polyhydroxyalkanoate synthesis regulator phasin
MSQNSQTADEWGEVFEQFNQATMEGIEGALEEQAAFTEAWIDAVEEGTAEAADVQADPETFVKSYAVWIDATERLFERLTDAIEGEEVEPGELRDVWLDAANEAFSDVMSSSAFAAATGQTIDSALDAQEAADDATRDVLHAYGLATDEDVREVGERLVELERRQHSVENKLDRVLETLEE